MNAPQIDTLTVNVYTVPTDQLEADGTLEWDKTTMVMVEVAGGGETGLGYTYAARACQTLIHDVLADAVRQRPVFDVSGSWESMVRATRNLGRPGLVSCAISAVDTALWDLKGKLLGVPVCQLLGVVHPRVPVYGSGGFTTYDDSTMCRQIGHWVDDLAIPRVKIKIGEAWGHNAKRDVARVNLLRREFGPTIELYVDANGGYTRKQAIRVAEELHEQGVTWFEEPVSSDDLDGLREIRRQTPIDVAAGEYGFSLDYFARMVSADAVDCLQVDVTRCGGITEWVRAATIAAAAGLQVSGHCAPNLHAHVAAAVANLRHLEYFHDHVRIENMFFDGALEASGGTVTPDQGRPGLGLELKRSVAERYQVR